MCTWRPYQPNGTIRRGEILQKQREIHLLDNIGRTLHDVSKQWIWYFFIMLLTNPNCVNGSWIGNDIKLQEGNEGPL